jgi:hypothetical protein
LPSRRKYEERLGGAYVGELAAAFARLKALPAPAA